MRRSFVGAGWENLLHRHPKGDGDAIGEIEGGVVAVGFQRVDRLARDADGGAELLLRPAALGPKHAQTALQGRVSLMNGVTMPNAPQ
jgi:hypothetical protein